VLLYNYANIWRVSNQMGVVLMATAIGTGFGIFFSLLGAHWASLVGAGIGWLASQWLAFGGVMIWLRYIQINDLDDKAVSST
jgi:O-antigen/teichoic acid export membrane protein